MRPGARSLLRACVTGLGLLLAWQLVVSLTGAPSYLLPSPTRVGIALIDRWSLLASHALTTALEVVLGLGLGTLLGVVAAIALVGSASARRWLLPLIVVSQAIPVFALAPLLVLWLGYGMASKVAVAILIIFFPVTAAFFDGLQRTAPGWLELARVMNARPGATLLQIRVPAALPAFASGLRVAAAVAPIGAVVGEWVGAAKGLGYLMLHANGRMQTDLLFAAMLLLCLMALGLWFAVDRGLKRLITWQAES